MAPISQQTRGGPDRRKWIAACAVVGLGLATAGYLYYRAERREILETSYQQLDAIVELKTQHILEWRRERLIDVVVMAANPRLSEGIAPGASPASRERMDAALEFYLRLRGPQYASALLVTADGHVLARAGAARDPVGAVTLRAIREVFAGRGPMLSDVFREDDGSMHLDAVALVGTGPNDMLAAALLRSDARNFLFPLIREWPTPNLTAETNIVERDGDDVVCLNEPRHPSSAGAPPPRGPVTLVDSPAVQAVLGARGRVVGTDYRGVGVIADVQPIPESPWFLVAKTDAREIQDVARGKAEAIVIAVLVLTLLAGAMTAHLYRGHREAALRDSVERFNLATRATYNVIWDYDLVTGAIWRNDNYVSLFGYPTATKADLDEWATRLHPDDRDRIRAAVDAALHSDATSWSDTFRYRRRDGSYAVVEDRCEILRDAGGRAIRMIGAMHDVTDRETAEQLLRLQGAALDAAANGIVITDRAGSIVWANSGFTALTGYTAAEAVGRNPRDLLKSGVHDRDFYRGLWDAVLKGDVWDGEMTNRRKDGSLYSERQTITPLRAPDGSIAHFIAIKEDLTERKRLEQQFLQSQKMEVVGRLAGGIAHDFNNLLTVINMSADLLVSELPPDDPLRDDAAHIVEAGARAASLTRQLLAFSRKQVLKPDVLDLGDLARGMQNMLQRLIGVEIVLSVTSADDLGLVKADAGQIEQVVMNLAVNARDAMPDGGRLTIAATDVHVGAGDTAADLAPGPYVVLSVTDTGCGMDAETRSHLFEPFFSTKDPGRGTGLGLSTVYGIVKQSGGGITVDSTPGQGSTFRIYLPRCAGNPALERAAS